MADAGAEPRASASFALSYTCCNHTTRADWKTGMKVSKKHHDWNLSNQVSPLDGGRSSAEKSAVAIVVRKSVAEYPKRSPQETGNHMVKPLASTTNASGSMTFTT
eukprot:CAMPEP_0117619366 /NCGR_PEP_ID=MMETSP0784-20121206/86580_1 /TAXON_ID=39447 /ORGANISM="" /LENGTH=104 /DNA_ID=CAMNT_0005423255 /DNA_START=396 /DNA_END=711 /DNA_ORIENTATION=+